MTDDTHSTSVARNDKASSSVHEPETSGAATQPPTFEFNDLDKRCFTCQAEAHAARYGFESLTRAQRSHWSMWGCTCTDEQAREAQAYIDLMSR